MLQLLRPLIFGFVCAVFLLTQSANASPDEAKVLIESSSQEVLDILASDAISMEEKEHKLAALFDRILDLPWMARFSLGRHWKMVTEKQREEYMRLNHALLFQKYLPEIKEFPQQKLAFKQQLDLGDNEYIVHTQLTGVDETITDVSYKVRKNADGTYKIFDVISDGISLINTQRLEFSSVLNRKGIEYLIYKLGVRTASVQKYLASMSF